MSVGNVFERMIAFSDGNVQDINHYLKVYAFSKMIGEQEQLDNATQEVLELAAIVHDIGRPLCKEKYGSTEGKLQEKEGAILARQLLESIGYGDDLIDRVCYLVAHHHTYTNVDGLDYQILLEADFFVNAGEKNLPIESIRSAMNKFFKTKTGIRLLQSIYPATR